MKEHLCNCLEDYQKKLEELRLNIEKNSYNADLLRTQKKQMKNKKITVQPSQTCDLCYGTVFDSTFYMYPCKHAFHRDCIVSMVDGSKKIDPKDAKVKLWIKQLRQEKEKIEKIHKLNKLRP